MLPDKNSPFFANKSTLSPQFEILNSINIPIIITDNYFTITFCNHAAHKLFECETKFNPTVYDKYFFNLFTDNSFGKNGFKKELQLRKNWKGKVELKSKNYSVKTSNLSLSILKDDFDNENGIMAVFEDMADKEFQLAIKRSEDKFNALFEHDPLMNITIETSGKIINANKTAALELGYRIEDIIGKSIYDFIFDDDKNNFEETIIKSISTPFQPYTFELRKLRSDFEIIWVKTTIYSILEDRGLSAIIINSENITSHKSTLNALILSEERLAATEQFSLIMSTFTTLEGNFIKVPKRFCDFVGYTEHELLGKNFRDITHPDDVEIQVQLWQQFVEGDKKSIELEKRYICKDKKLVWAYINSTAIRDLYGNVSQVLTYVKDITENKLAQEEIRKSERRYRLLVNSIKEIIFQTDLQGNWIFLNPAWEDITGFSVKDTLGKYFLDFVHKDDRELSLKKFHSLFHNQFENDKYEIRYNRADGKNCWMEAFAKPAFDDNENIIGIAGTLIDITERKLADESLRQSEERFRALVDNMLDPAYISDWQGNIIFSNNAGKNLLKNYETDNFKIANLKDFIHTEHITKYLNDLKILNSTGKGYLAEYRLTSINSIEVWVETLSSKIIFDGITANLVTFRDVSERRIFINQLKEAKEKAEESIRLKTNFLANMSHELRTPMAGILGYAEILKQEFKESEHKKMTDDLFDSGKRLMETLDLILELSKIEANKVEVRFTEINVAKKIIESIELFSRSAEQKQLYLLPHIKNENLFITADEDMLKEVIDNLLSNAIKFTRTGGIAVKVEENYYNDCPYVDIKFIDTGIGISKEHQEIIFEEFRQVSEGLNRKFEGTGLGLTISAKLVKMMNGSIHVESSGRNGSTFTIRFKKVEREQEFSKNHYNFSSNKDAIEISSEIDEDKILLIDDEISSQEILKLFLKGIKCRIDFASDRQTALILARENNYKAILICSNLEFSASELETVNLIKSLAGYEKVNIIAITGHDYTDKKTELEKLGFTNFLNKPFNKTVISELISNILETKIPSI